MKQLWNSGFDKNTKNYSEATEKVNISSNKYIGSGSDSQRNYSLKKIQPRKEGNLSSIVPFLSPRVALRKEEWLLAA